MREILFEKINLKSTLRYIFYLCDEELQKQKKLMLKITSTSNCSYYCSNINKMCVRCLHEWTSHKLYFDISRSLWRCNHMCGIVNRYDWVLLFALNWALGEHFLPHFSNRKVLFVFLASYFCYMFMHTFVDLHNEIVMKFNTHEMYKKYCRINKNSTSSIVWVYFSKIEFPIIRKCSSIISNLLNSNKRIFISVL